MVDRCLGRLSRSVDDAFGLRQLSLVRLLRFIQGALCLGLLRSRSLEQSLQLGIALGFGVEVALGERIVGGPFCKQTLNDSRDRPFALGIRLHALAKGSHERRDLFGQACRKVVEPLLETGSLKKIHGERFTSCREGVPHPAERILQIVRLRGVSIHRIAKGRHLSGRSLPFGEEVVLHHGVEGVPKAERLGLRLRQLRIDLSDLRDLVPQLDEDLRHVS